MSNDVDVCEVEADIESLQAQLADRESLVTELTARLELAAEQLDRLQRSGAGRNPVLGGLPPELVEDQQALTEELQAAVQQWAELQPATLLAQIEMQVAEVRDLIVERLDPNAMAALAATANHRGGDEAADDDEESLSSYEAFKAGLTDSDELEDESPASEDVAASSDDDAEFDSQEREAATEMPAEVDPPEPIDFETAEIDDLHEALEQRDCYIAYLTSRLRLAEAKSRPRGTWSELAGVPEDLRPRLEELERSLEESLRMHEVATSLERARLGREANRLELLDLQLRRRAAKLGVEIDGATDDDSSAEADSESTINADESETAPRRKKRRWPFFGRKRND